MGDHSNSEKLKLRSVRYARCDIIFGFEKSYFDFWVQLFFCYLLGQISNLILKLLFRCVSPTCMTPIGKTDYLIVKTTGIVTYPDPRNSGQLVKKEGNVYLHFLDECLNNYFDSFKYENIVVPDDTRKSLKSSEITFLRSYGINIAT